MKKKLVSIRHYHTQDILAGVVEFNRNNNGKVSSADYKPGTMSLRRLADVVNKNIETMLVETRCILHYGGSSTAIYTGEQYNAEETPEVVECREGLQ